MAWLGDRKPFREVRAPPGADLPLILSGLDADGFFRSCEGAQGGGGANVRRRFRGFAVDNIKPAGFPAFNLAKRLGQVGSFAAGTPRRLRRGNAGMTRFRSAVAQLPPLASGATINSSTYTSGTALRARRGPPRTPTPWPAPWSLRLELRCNFDCVCPDRSPGAPATAFPYPRGSRRSPGTTLAY